MLIIKFRSLLAILFFLTQPLLGTCCDRDVLLEFKAAYFLPTSHLFKEIYHGSAIYGPEATVQICDQWYGFFSADFFNKKGYSIGLSTPTKVSLVNIGIGLKYFVPFCYGDFYVGLGAMPTRLHTHDESPYVIPYRTNWGCGGIAKIGAYFDVTDCFVFDLFFNYSFVKIGFSNPPAAPTVSNNARVNGCWFGAGLAYRF